MKDADGFFLKVRIEASEVRVRGNARGLIFLSDVCKRIIGKKDPSGHIHIDPKMGNASDGSLPMVVEFTEAEK